MGVLVWVTQALGERDGERKLFPHCGRQAGEERGVEEAWGGGGEEAWLSKQTLKKEGGDMKRPGEEEEEGGDMKRPGEEEEGGDMKRPRGGGGRWGHEEAWGGGGGRWGHEEAWGGGGGRWGHEEAPGRRRRKVGT